MKYCKLLFFLFLPLLTTSQETKTDDIQLIKEVVNQFFESLEKKDTMLMLEVIIPEGQVWRIYNEKIESDLDRRPYTEDVASLKNIPDVREVAKDFEIRVDKKIAMAWVPYEFFIDDVFSHCGTDVFTLFRVGDSWKIATAAYSVQKMGCED